MLSLAEGESGYDYRVCDTHCGFDTFYPEYFPPRFGFEEVSKQLQEFGMRILPYINGRIFDIGTQSWTANDLIAQKSASKQSESVINPTAQNLSYWHESYGSLADFVIQCPYSEYWQDTIADTVDKLVSFYGMDGVYIDQIACAEAKPCYDPTHNHSIGGGNHFQVGNNKLLSAAQQKIGGNHIIMTEGQQEYYIGGADVFLTLVGFDAGKPYFT